LEQEYVPQPPLVVMVSAGILAIYIASCIVGAGPDDWAMQYAWDEHWGAEGLDLFYVHKLGPTTNTANPDSITHSYRGKNTTLFPNERKVEFDHFGLHIERDNVLRSTNWGGPKGMGTSEGLTRIRLWQVDAGLIMFVFASLPVIYVIGIFAAGAKAILRVRKRRCWKCGYDVRRSVYRCPECGTQIKRG